VEALIQRAEAEPQWQATRHYNWELGDWIRLSDEDDCSIDWIEYFQRECKEAKRRFNCDLTTTMYCQYWCVGCWLWRALRSSDAVVVLADAVLNDSAPDHFRFEPEEELLIQEALAYHRGDLASESDEEDEEDDGDDFYESGYESE
jgi:hypothetical protein